MDTGHPLGKFGDSDARARHHCGERERPVDELLIGKVERGRVTESGKAGAH
jgi:hypothetical protein